MSSVTVVSTVSVVPVSYRPRCLPSCWEIACNGVSDCCPTRSSRSPPPVAKLVDSRWGHAAIPWKFSSPPFGNPGGDESKVDVHSGDLGGTSLRLLLPVASPTIRVDPSDSIIDEVYWRLNAILAPLPPICANDICLRKILGHDRGSVVGDP